MIRSKDDLQVFLEADKYALGRKRRKPRINDYIWKYEIALRKCEYYQNTKSSFFSKIMHSIIKLKRSRIGLLCGFEIPVNVVDKGLCIAHSGTIIISEYARLGQNCRIHAGVNIGADARKYNAAPQIGNDVYIGPGAKLFGEITIADKVAIGANAVVNHSFTTPNISIGGIPAKILGEIGTEGILFNRKDNLT